MCTFFGYLKNRLGPFGACRSFCDILSTPSILQQISARSKEIHRVPKPVEDDTPDNTDNYIRSMNSWSRMFVDAALGVAVMVTLLRGNTCEEISEFTLSWADTVVILLNRLLTWLLGVPAGLKLNSPLNQFLGKFFQYHIYLWTGYLSLLKPALVYLIQGAAILGVFGFTYQLCFLQDIFSTLTLHIYCFYVYAARLYYFQIYALSSLWRLFRGRKWNVLKKRVDLASYDVDQLFVGTILFTILLFLLPTTALYYFVFMSLRLLVVLVNGVVAKVVSFFNDLPLFALVLRLVGSRSTTGNVYYDISEDSITKKTSQIPYSQLYQHFTKQPTKASYTWRDFLQKVMLGELIYPWNDKRNVDTVLLCEDLANR